MPNHFPLALRLALAGLSIASLAIPGRAAVVVAGPGAFSGAPVTFAGVADGTEVNGLTVNGILFNYLLAGVATNGAVVIDGGPGITNSVNPPNVVSIGNNAGTLALTLPGLTSGIGYGYAILATGSNVANATTVSLFNNATFVGSLSYLGIPDPAFVGGFAGILSTLPFNRVELTFNTTNASAFAVDNFVFSNVNVPEPSTWILALFGGGTILYRRLRI